MGRKKEAVLRYTVTFLEDDRGRGYTAVVPALPGCVTQGRTLPEALRNAREAIVCHVEGLKKAGETVPDDIAIAAHIQVAA